MKFSRFPKLSRFFPIFFAATFACGVAPAQSGTTVSMSQPSSELPNIVFIMADDLGYGDVSCNQTGSKIETPNIDRIADAGMRFTNAHTPSSVCTPTRYGLLTGRYAWRTHLKSGVLMASNRAPLIENGRLTVAELLRENGYATAMVGKWHLGMNFSTPPLNDPQWIEQEITGGPVDEGFEHYFGVGGSANFSPYIYIRDRKFTEIATEQVTGVQHMFDGPKAAGYEADEVVGRTAEEAAQYIRDLAGGEKPFFLYFALTSPHYPIVPHQDFIGSSGLEGPYGDFVVETDAAVGTVLKALTETGEAANTLIIFTADNGCARQANFSQLTSQGHNPSGGLRGGKQHIYEGGHRVPLVVAWPRRIEPGQVTNAMVCLTDLMRTSAALVGADLPPDAGEDSYDMLPHLLGTPPTGPVRPHVVSHSAGGNFAIQDDTWKLIFANDGGYRLLTAYPNAGDWPTHEYDTFQLYNLQQDLREFTNLYTDHPDIVQTLTDKMTQIVDQGRGTPGPAQQNHNGQNRWKQVNWVE